MLTFWRELRQNPIYLRESGQWGEPNATFAWLKRYSPFLVIAVFVLTACCGLSNNSFFLGLDSDLAVFWVLVCLPNVVMQGLLWAAVLLVPALTAPSISEERKRGTWDMLRLTPQPMWHILLAKLFGGLARLKIWWPMLAVSLFQIGGSAVGILLAQDFLASNLASLFGVIAMSVAMAARPWLEVICIALLGVNASAVTYSARSGLVATYASVLLLRGGISLASLFALYWATEWLNLEADSLAISNIAAVVLYLITAAILTGLLRWQANRLDALDAFVSPE